MPLSREDAELWAATRVIAMHAPDGHCAQCTPDGCRLHQWAAARLARWEAGHGRTYVSAPTLPTPHTLVARPMPLTTLMRIDDFYLVAAGGVPYGCQARRWLARFAGGRNLAMHDAPAWSWWRGEARWVWRVGFCVMRPVAHGRTQPRVPVTES